MGLTAENHFLKFLPFVQYFCFISNTEMSDENFSLTSLAHKMRETKKNIHKNQNCINRNPANVENHVSY